MRGMRRLEIDDVIRLNRIGLLDVSVKGDLAYTVSVPRPDDNKYQGEIRILWRDGGETYFQGKDDAAPSWSPDGELLAFISRRGEDKKEGNGVYVVGRGGEPRLVAWFKHGVSGVEWLDGKTLIVLAGEEADGYDPDGDYVYTDNAPLWFDRMGIIAGKRDQLYRVEVESGHVKKLTEEEHGVLEYEVHMGKIYYTIYEDWINPLKNKLKVLDPKTGESREILSDMHIYRPKSIGEKLYFLGHRFEIGISSHGRLYMLYNNMPECLSCGILDRDITGIYGDYMGDPVITYSDSGMSILARYRGGRIEDLVGGEKYVLQASAKGRHLYYVMSSPIQPPEIYRYGEEVEERITSLNTWLVEEAKLYMPEKLTVEAEGEEIDGWVIRPDGDGPYPLILYIHGGPKGMYGYYFHPEMQLMASQGFLVAYCNPHGSEGYTEEFADIRGRYGETDYRQIMRFVEEVMERYPVDREKTAVTGISYGGYMTNWIITQTDMFKAAVSENGIADWIADYWASDIGYWFNPDQIGGTPLDNLEKYVEKSPAYHAHRVKTPVLIIHSLQDYRCYIDQALAMHLALRTLKKESRLLVFLKGSHGHSVLAEPRHRKKRLELKIKWIKEKLGIKDQDKNKDREDERTTKNTKNT